MSDKPIEQQHQVREDFKHLMDDGKRNYVK